MRRCAYDYSANACAQWRWWLESLPNRINHCNALSSLGMLMAVRKWSSCVKIFCSFYFPSSCCYRHNETSIRRLNQARWIDVHGRPLVQCSPVAFHRWFICTACSMTMVQYQTFILLPLFFTPVSLHFRNHKITTRRLPYCGSSFHLGPNERYPLTNAWLNVLNWQKITNDVNT